MTNTTLLRRLRTGTAALPLALMAFSFPAAAQDPAAQSTTAQDAATQPPATDAGAAGGGEIVVTGSRISRPDLTAASPVTSIAAAQLQLSNKPGVEELLRDIPQAVAGLGQNLNNGNPGVATVNLRNLGAVRTLVLVDGHRFVPYDSNGIVDLNMIPERLIKRVDVVTGGASAVYGSDAIAGVVNFILDDTFQGVEANAQTSTTSRGDGFTYQGSLTAGIRLGDRGHIVANGSYTNVKAVTQGARGYSTFALASADFSPGGSSTNEYGSIDTPDGRYTFTPNGFQPYSGARDSFNFNPQNLLQVPQEKWNATVLANYEITDDVEFYARGSYGKSKVITDIGSSGTFGLSFDINYRDNPYLDPAVNPNAAGARAILAQYDNGEDGDTTAGDGIVNLGLRRRITELGPRESQYSSEAYQGVAGLRGNFGANKQLHWEVFGQYGRSTRDQAFLNDVSLTKAQQALLVVNGPNGPQCTDTSGGCVPANLFGIGTLSAAAADFIKFGISEKDKNQQYVAGGFLSGDLPFELAESHPAAFSLGVEYRKEKAFNLPDDNYIEGNAIGYGASSVVDASFDVKEVYGELKVPLIVDKPFFKTLGLETGFRYSSYHNRTTVYDGPLDVATTTGTKYKNSFNNWTFKIGGDWKPVDSISFRVMFQRAVRAPNLQEIGLPRTSGTGDALFDPCAAGTFNPSNATLRSLCETVGGGVAPDRVGQIDQPTSGQVNNFSGGNPNLVPEKANTLTIGTVLTPTFLRDFNATVDYFDIKVKKAILATPEQAILDACYYAEQDPNGTFCSLIHRNASNYSLEGDFIYGVDATRRNIGLIRERGIDVTANYRPELFSNAHLVLGLALTYTINSQVQFASVLRTYECVGQVGKTCTNPQPKWRWIQTTGFEYGPALIQLSWRHMSSITNDTILGKVGYVVQPDSAFVVPRIKPFSWFDLSVRFKLAPAFEFRVGVDNITDKQPPVVGNDYGNTTYNSGNTYPATYEPLGRVFNAGVTARF